MLDVERRAELRREHFVRGVPIKELVRRTGLARNTIRVALRSDEPPAFRVRERLSKLEPFKDEVRPVCLAAADVISERCMGRGRSVSGICGAEPAGAGDIGLPAIETSRSCAAVSALPERIGRWCHALKKEPSMRALPEARISFAALGP